MPADSMFAARSQARISANPASRAATQNLADFTGTVYLPNGGARHDQVSWPMQHKPGDFELSTAGLAQALDQLQLTIGKI